MNWSRRHALLGGIALILVTNAVALTGVAYNRSGEPDSRLQLTQRELTLPAAWGLEGESGGIALELEWRVLEAQTGASSGISYSRSGAPEWLDTAKLATLGFDVDPSTIRRSERYPRQLPREVLLVLEMDGTAYRQALERARIHAQREAALLAADPANQQLFQGARYAREQLDREERQNTRLFVVDAGLDPAALRAAHPDRSRYALVRGRVRPYVAGVAEQARLRGYIDGLSIDRVSVPHAFREAFEPLLRLRSSRRYDVQTAYTVDVAFGKRFEPWVIGATGEPAISQ